MKKNLIAAAIGLAACGFVSAVSAGDFAHMTGKWGWEGFTIEVVEADPNGISATVVDGPKNVGMEMIQSPLKPKDDAMVGRVKHPANGEVYNSKMSMPDPDTWQMDGCTDGGA
ncbi:MAG: DUF2147 domain-containing protein, partial [Chromatiales bacterium]